MALGHPLHLGMKVAIPIPAARMSILGDAQWWSYDQQLTELQDAHLAVGHAVEVIGKVDGNLAIKVQAATDFGTSIGTFDCVAFWKKG